MRKRAQRRSKPIVEEPKHIIVQKTRIEKKPVGFKKNWWVAASLIGIFLLVLFLNSYFNITSEISINPEGKDFDKYYLSGPDPYYNMRLVNETFETGRYPFYSDRDPLLNYPFGTSGARPPFLNMLALGFSRVLTPFMNEIDAIGYSMQFIPALFGALLVFPVYFIGKTLFGRKAGLAGALFVALIPIHIGSGHGSAYSLFDHDSLNLLLFFLAFLFLIKGIKDKDPGRSILYALLSGISLGALSMTWVEGQFLYVVIATYAVIQMLIDIFTNKIEIGVVRTPLVALFSGYLISLPVRLAALGGSPFETPLFLCIFVAVFGAAYLIFHRKKIPWTISLPMVFCAGGIGLTFLYFIGDISRYIPFFSRLGSLSNIVFGAGIYGTKVEMTIAEANTHNISYSVMSFGPALYWLGWAGLMFLIYRYFKDKQRKDYLLIIVVFLVDIWLIGISGRFTNDIVPLIAILGGWILWMIVDKIDYKQMIKNIRRAGGSIHGLRRGVKISHIFGILFVAFLVIFPNAYLAFVMAVPDYKKADVFGEDAPTGVFGLGYGKEAYWVDAYNWLNQQDVEIEDPAERPAFISWWDYGFYGVAVGEHPVVADNFQDGIPPAANFHTAASEKEAIAVWIVRLIQGGPRDEEGRLSEDIVLTFKKYLGENDTVNITSWIENPGSSPSYKAPIGKEYDEELSKQYRAGEQYTMNVVYHDVAEILVNKIDDEGITWLYHDIQNVTGYSIRYYGVEGYDKQIFNIFGFLADKSLLLVGAPEDDFVKVFYTGYHINDDGSRGADGEWSVNEIKEMPVEERRKIAITNTRSQYKDAYFETMFYRAYIGIAEGSSGSKSEPRYQLPCIDMRHFSAEFISKYPSPFTNKYAVVIAKYYEGAYVNGSVTFMGNPIQSQVVVQKNITFYGLSIPIDHDKANTANGEFSLIVPAGDIILQVRRYPELGVPLLGGNAFILKNVTFDSNSDPELAPITDAEAMRTAGTNYEREINISIDPASLVGYVYLNKDDTDAYNASIDEPLANVKVTLQEIQTFTETGATIIERESLTTDENGYYNASGLMPGFYVVRAELNDFVIHEEYIPVYSGDNTYDISKPEPAAVEGIVYYDGEEMSDVDIKLLYMKLDGDKKLVDSTKTDENGIYSFSSIYTANIPLTYIINASKLTDYTAEEEITLSENETKAFDISLGLVPVTVSGYTQYNDEDVGNIKIMFSPDGSVDDNTAEEAEITSDDAGYYNVELMPGSYNVTVDEIVNESGQNVKYIFSGQLELHIGEGTRPFDIMMTKEEIP